MNTQEIVLMPGTLLCPECYRAMTIMEMASSKNIVVVSCSNTKCSKHTIDYSVNLPTVIGVEVNSLEILVDQVMDHAIAAGATFSWKKHEYHKGKWVKLPGQEEEEKVGEVLLPPLPPKEPKAAKSTKKPGRPKKGE